MFLTDSVAVVGAGAGAGAGVGAGASAPTEAAGLAGSAVSELSTELALVVGRPASRRNFIIFSGVGSSPI
jgi:hypothetical protein